MKRYVIYASSDKLNVEDRIAQAKSTTDPQLLASLADDRSDKVKLVVAKNPNTPANVLVDLYNQDIQYKYNSAIKSAILTNPNAPIELVLKVIKWDNGFTYAIAKSKPTDPIILRELGKSKDLDTLSLVAKNPNTPTRTLRNLYKRAYVEEELASNPNTPLDILKEIANGADAKLRSKVMKNPQISGELRDEVSAQGHDAPFDKYVGQDIWVEAEQPGISRDHTCYVRLISKKNKSNFRDEYTYNMIEGITPISDYDLTSTMTSPIGVSSYGADYDIWIYKDAETYTTDELIDMFGEK